MMNGIEETFNNVIHMVTETLYERYNVKRSELEISFHVSPEHYFKTACIIRYLGQHVFSGYVETPEWGNSRIQSLIIMCETILSEKGQVIQFFEAIKTLTE